MSPEIPREWLDRASQDASGARLILEHRTGSATAAFLMHEATEKALKGYLITTGWELCKTHALLSLLKTACSKDRRFEAFSELVERVDAHVRWRYLTIPEKRLSEETLLKESVGVEALIALAREAVKDTLQ